MENEQEHLFTTRDGKEVYGTRRPADEEMKRRLAQRNQKEHEYARWLSEGMEKSRKDKPESPPPARPQDKPKIEHHRVPTEHDDKEWPQAA